MRSAWPTSMHVRHGGRRRAADRARDRRFVALGIERAGGDEGAGGRAADAGIAMHHDRRARGPSRCTKSIRSCDMLLGRARCSRPSAMAMSSMPRMRWLVSTIAGRPLHAVDQPQQRDDVARAGLRDGVVQAGEGADVNHSCPWHFSSDLRRYKCRRRSRRSVNCAASIWNALEKALFGGPAGHGVR